VTKVIKKIIIGVTIIFFCLCLASCSVDNTTGSVNESIKPDNGQPDFPGLEKYWVIDSDHYIKQETIDFADPVLEKIRQDGIAEVVIIIQKGIVNKGPFNDEKIWAMNWGRWAKLGDKEDQRAIVWLIRPDVKPEENRVTIEISTHLTWYTAVDYSPALEEAAEYANVNDFDGAVQSLIRNTDEVLRKLWQEKKESGGK
jgi:hypothetical protein